MEREAAAREAVVRQRALDEAARITREAEARIAERRKAVVQAECVSLRQETNRRVAAARQEGRAEALRLRAELLGRVRALARERLAGALERETYRAQLPRELASSLEYIPGPGAIVRAAPAFVAALARGNGRNVAVTGDPAILAGFVVRSADGTIEVNQTLEYRLDAMWPTLSINLIRSLENDP